MPTSARPTCDAIRAVHRVCKILNTLADAPDRTVLNYVAEAANVPEELCTPPSGGTRISALRGTSRGVRLLPPGLTFRPPSIAALERLAEAARPALDQLHGEISETTNLGILDGTPGGAQRRVVGVPAHMRLAAQVRACGHVHCTTLGKAILIEMPHQRVPTMLQAAGMPQTRPFTLDPGVSRERPRRIREQGYAVDEEANQPHGRCGSSHCQTIASPASRPSKSPAGYTASPGRSSGRCKADPTHPRP